MLERLEVLRTRFWELVMPVLIGIFVLLIVGMGIVYFQQRRVQGSLEPQISQLRSTVLNSVHITEELRTEYAEALEAIPTELETSYVIQTVLGIAEGNGFGASDIQKIQADDKLRSEKVRGTTYQVMVFTMTVSGGYDKVMGLVIEMNSPAVLKTLVVERLSIKKIDQDEVTADLTFGVYTLPS